MNNIPALQINDTGIIPGTNVYIDIPVTRLYTHALITIPVHCRIGAT